MSIVTTRPSSEVLGQYKCLVEQFLHKVLPQPNAKIPLFAALRYAVLNNGKRMRPALVYAVGELLEIPIERLHAAAASIELIHCYSLVHDDLPSMDDDDLRRGMPTCHKAFDEATAILTGDALQALAFQVLSDPLLNPVPAVKQIAMVNTIAKSAGCLGMVLGQAEDLAAEHKTLNLQELTSIHRHKTGALIEACVELAILCCETDVSEAAELRKFAQHLGLAFQIQDDILDVIGDANTLGKNTGSDQKQAKSTFVSLMGINEAFEHANFNLNAALEAATSLGERAELLIQYAKFLMIRVTNALEKAS